MFTYQHEVHSVNTRGSQNNLIWIDKNITSKIHRDSFRYYAPSQYNKLPAKIKNCTSVSSFKSNLTKYLNNN